MGVFPTKAFSGRLTIGLPGAEPLMLDAELSPEQPFVGEVGLPEGAPGQGQVAISLTDGAGATLFEWQGPVQLR